MMKSRLVKRAVELLMRRRLMNAAILAVACALGILSATTGFGTSVENTLQAVRQSTMTRNASGDVVVIAIDGRSMNEVANWPWPRGIHGQIVDRLRDAGAKKIAFDISFTNPSGDPKQDELFAQALARANDKVMLPGVISDSNPALGKYDSVGTMPTALLARHSQVSNIYVMLDDDFAARRLSYAKKIGGKDRPSTAAFLAGVQGADGQTFPIDWSINPDTIPVYSYADVLNGKVARARLAGKSVIIGATAETLGDRYTVPNYGRIPGLYIQAIGAETLLRHVPIDIGTWPLLVGIGMILLWGATSRRTVILWTSVAVSATCVLVAPYVLESFTPIVTPVMPALILTMSFLSMQSAYLGLRALITYLTQSTTSHLPNMLAMSLEPVNPGITVVVRMRNYVETTALLGVAARGDLMRKMHSRLEMANNGETIFQTDENSFAWHSSKTIEQIADSIEGLYALFSPGISIGDLTVDAMIAIGLCDDEDLGIEDSVVAATLAADRAAQRNLRWERYESEREDVNWRLSLLSELDSAIDKGDVWVAYQPKYDIATSKVSGAEALVRWTHPERGFIAPDRFIPIVEEANRIDKLTLHVLETSIRDFGGMAGDLGISVNISARMLGHDRLLEPVKAMLQKYGMDARLLTLEITESAEMAGDSGVAELTALRAIGVTISIDDYGTGQSTLSYLKRLPATEIKIDRSFVANVLTNRSDATVVDSTIKLAHALGMKVVAEGVETQDVLDALAAMECDVIQGYHISRPVSFGEFQALDVVRRAVPGIGGGVAKAA